MSGPVEDRKILLSMYVFIHTENTENTENRSNKFLISLRGLRDQNPKKIKICLINSNLSKNLHIRIL